MYASGVLTVLVTLAWGHFLSPESSVLLGGVLLIPGGLDGTTQSILDRESTNGLRVLTGLLLGVGIILFMNGMFLLFFGT
jgi:uncharacterized membrane protein